jgi:hypothetical protein
MSAPDDGKGERVYISPLNLYFIVMMVTGAIGFARGWRREIITLAIELTAVIFLQFGGIWYLWEFIFVKIGEAFRTLFFGPEDFGVSTPQIDKPDPWGTAWAIITFVGLTWLAYVVGTRYGARAVDWWTHFVGFAVGMSTGVAIMWYATHKFSTVNSTSWVSDAWTAPVLGLGLAVAFVSLLVSKK